MATTSLAAKIQKEDVHTIYGLSFRSSTNKLGLDISLEAQDYLQSKQRDIEIVDDLGKYLGLKASEFVVPSQVSKQCGYGGVLRRAPVEANEMATWVAATPILDRYEDCSLSSMEWQKLIRISASLNVIFQALANFEGESYAQNHQLMAFDTMSLSNDLGFEISIYISRKLALWLKSISAWEDGSTITGAMRKAFQVMCPKFSGDAEVAKEYVAKIGKDGRIELDTHEGSLIPVVKEDTNGYTLHSKRAGPIEQYCILCGFGAIHDLARDHGL